MNDQSKKPSRHKHPDSDNSAPYPVSRLAPSFGLVDLAREIEEADRMVNTTAHARLRVIADQVLRLKEEARRVLEETRESQELHRAKCNFRKIPGKIYHLYRKENGELYFSMLSPQEWAGAGQHEFIGSYRLENDLSWKASNKTDQDDGLIAGLLDSL